MKTKHQAAFAWLVISSATAGTLWAQPEIIATGLQAPQRIILTPSGDLLVSETSMSINAGRISVVTRAGARRSLLEGLPSGIEVTLQGGSGPTAMALRDRTLYFLLGAGDSERRGSAPASQHNPEGTSSPIFASLLEARFSLDLDTLAGPFVMTPENQRALADGAEVEINDDNGGLARISMLARFPISEPDPVTVYRFSNPWGMALAEDGSTLYVVDASRNSLVRVDTSTGRWRTLTRFAPLPNPTPVGPPFLDAVPTSVRIYGNNLLVSFLTGFPFVPGRAHVLLVDSETGQPRPFIVGLTSVTDLLWLPRPGQRPQFFALEFSRNQSAQPPPPGRLLRYDTAEAQIAEPVLITPVSMAYDQTTQDLFILELRGQILRLRIE